MINCVLSCLANVSYYEKQATLTSDFEHKNLKSELVLIISNFIMQSDSEDICCEALRVLSNLSRSKDLIKLIIKYKLLDAVILLLDSNSKEIVYYAIGTLINLTNTDEIKFLFFIYLIYKYNVFSIWLLYFIFLIKYFYIHRRMIEAPVMNTLL